MEVTFCDKHGKMTDVDFSDICFTPSDRPHVQEVHKKLDLPFMKGEATQLSVRDVDIIYGDMLIKESQTVRFSAITEIGRAHV